MRLFLVFVCCFFMIIGLFSQAPSATHYYILWDVTYSMTGFKSYSSDKPLNCDDCVERNGAGNGWFSDKEDIWDATKESVLNQIDAIPTNGLTSVTLRAFEDLVSSNENYTVQKYIGFTEENKESLRNWILNHKFEFQGRNTNICDALQGAVDEIQNNSSANYKYNVMLYTDGKQSSVPIRVKDGNGNVIAYNNDNKRNCVGQVLKNFCKNCTTDIDSDIVYWMDLKTEMNNNMYLPCDCIIQPKCRDNSGTITPVKNVILTLENSIILAYDEVESNNQKINIPIVEDLGGNWTSLVQMVNANQINLNMQTNSELFQLEEIRDDVIVVSCNATITPGQTISERIQFNFSVPSSEECWTFQFNNNPKLTVARRILKKIIIEPAVIKDK